MTMLPLTIQGSYMFVVSTTPMIIPALNCRFSSSMTALVLHVILLWLKLGLIAHLFCLR